MVYVYKKVIGNKSYYYLRSSETINGVRKVKDLLYLGNDLSKVDLEALLKGKNKNIVVRGYNSLSKEIESNKYYNLISDKNIKKSKFLANDMLQKVEGIKLHYNNKVLLENKLTIVDVLSNFAISYTYNTTSIEGNTIPLIGVKNYIENSNVPSNSTLREIHDIENTITVFNRLSEYKDITKETIIRIHTDLMKNIDDRIGFRKHNVRVIKSRFDATPYPLVAKEIDELIYWYNSAKNNEHPFVLSILFHHKFEKIHPFSDGNGRCGRMLMNLILKINNYPPIIVRRKNRASYIDSLHKADSGNYSELTSFMLKEYLDSYWDFFNI